MSFGILLTAWLQLSVPADKNTYIKLKPFADTCLFSLFGFLLAILLMDKIICDLTWTCTKWLVTWLAITPNDLRLDLTCYQIDLDLTWLAADCMTWDLTWTCMNWLETWLGLARNDLSPSLPRSPYLPPQPSNLSYPSGFIWPLRVND